MRRKIELYINGTLADLSDQGLVLFNYSLTDLQKPTAVKNGFSKQITLPGTPRNDRIFGAFFRLDRVTGSGFNALLRVPFRIYTAQGEVLQSGYVKLDKVTRSRGTVHSYSVTLYGETGSFLYGLMYDSEGQTRKLSDMAYCYKFGSGNTIKNLDLTRNINAGMIMTAWDRILEYDEEKESHAKYRVLNFAPCYNGLPDSFDANKVLYNVAAGFQVPSSLTDDDGNVFTPHNGWALITLPREWDEWEIRDLRSYYQRPVLNVKALLDTISLPENNGGYTIDWQVRPPHEEDLWLTLKRPVQLEVANGDIHQVISEKTAESGDMFCRKVISSFPIQGSGYTTLALTLTPRIRVQYSDSQLYEAYDRYKGSTTEQETCAAATFVQVVVRDSSGNIKAASSVYAFSNATGRKTLAEVVTDAWEMESIYQTAPADFFAGDLTITHVNGRYNRASGSGTPEYVWSNPVQLTLTGERFASYEIRILRRSDEHRHVSNVGNHYYDQTGWSPSLASYGPGYVGYLWSIVEGTADTTIPSPRSMVDITQEEFLNTDHSIADYLLSILKAYGLYLSVDEVEKKVTVMSRNGFYGDRDIIDLTGRIDTSKDIVVTPLKLETRIYTMELEAIGAKAEEYATRYSSQYGSYRVNTGYEFTAAAIDIADGIVFKTAVPYVARGKAYTWPHVGATERQNFEVDGYELQMGDPKGSAYTAHIPGINPTSYASFSDILPFADAFDKAQFCDADNKGVDGEDCLLFMQPQAEWGPSDGYPYYQLTDDNDEMYYQNGDKPCWLCVWNAAISGGGVFQVRSSSAIPHFRPALEGAWLTFGIPQEIYDPLIETWSDDWTFYAKYWRSYLRDLLDQDTKVMKCRVNLEGLQVGPQLLRRFFWYDNSLWVLNKITNYSLTTYDPAECEFVQVRNIENYTNGQIWTW